MLIKIINYLICQNILEIYYFFILALHANNEFIIGISVRLVLGTKLLNLAVKIPKISWQVCAVGLTQAWKKVIKSWDKNDFKPEYIFPGLCLI